MSHPATRSHRGMQVPENNLGKVMKRIAIWAFYGVGALAVAYLGLYAYAVFSGRDLQPGDPIHIFRKPDAPSYSTSSTSLRATRSARSAAG